MDFRTLVRILRLRWKVVLGATVSCLVAAVVVTMFQTKSYQASAAILMSFSGAATINDVYEATQASQQRLSSYAEIAGGRAVAQRAIEQLGLPMDAETLVDNTDVTYTPESTVFRLSVADFDPRRAAALATAMANQFAALVPELDGHNVVDVSGGHGLGMTIDPAQLPPVAATAIVVEQPVAPWHPRNPVPARNISLGLVAGMLLGSALAIARNATDSTVRDSETVADRCGLSTLAKLPRSGPRSCVAAGDMGLVKHAEVFDGEAIRALRGRLMAEDRMHERTVLITGPTLGAGVSALSLQLALSFTEVDEIVLLVEGDPRKPAIAGMVGADSIHGFPDILEGSQVDDDVVLPTMYPMLSVLASTKATALPKSFNTASVTEVLEKLRGEYDRVIIDGPPALVSADAGILAAAVDTTVLVVRSGRTTVDEINGAVDNLQSAGGNVAGVVLTGTAMPRYAKNASSAYRARIKTIKPSGRHSNGC